ncbi:hypothetical protein FK220_017690 [Flavobacteriaceae bacterium TP-CH-4]|uniref:Uncharacterized protein n=1 Tax=Pelagihabitans pacificus TaxID=2696054 RepID=A0A967AXM8_9FLAO|nr:hypothetical protein [Pelagihabitans pacificus]NHF61190.1 hypothetical protein [Pelagihabitans pacificus]
MRNARCVVRTARHAMVMRDATNRVHGHCFLMIGAVGPLIGQGPIVIDYRLSGTAYRPHKGLQWKYRRPAPGGARNCNEKPDPTTRGDVPVKKTFAITLPFNGLLLS